MKQNSNTASTVFTMDQYLYQQYTQYDYNVDTLSVVYTYSAILKLYTLFTVELFIILLVWVGGGGGGAK